MQQAGRVTGTEVNYSGYENGNREVRFAELTMLGKPRFYENVMRLVEISGKEGFLVYFDLFDYSGIPDSLLRKLRRIRGFVPDRNGYRELFRPLVKQGFEVYEAGRLVPVRTGRDSAVDLPAGTIIEAWENRKGMVALSSKDMSGSPYHARYLKSALRRADNWTVRLRSAYLAEAVQSSSGRKILVLYGARHRKEFFSSLRKLDANWITTGKSNTRRDARFDHSLPPDTIRKFRQEGRIEQMSSHLNVKFSLNNYKETFFVDSDDLDLEIYPNTTTRARLSLHYQFITFSYSYTPRLLPGNDDDDLQGRTRSSGLAMDFSFHRWFQGLAYHRTKGYYINNTGDLNPSWQPGDPYIQSPELVYYNFQGVTGYSTNPAFSVSSLISQTERQLRSAGTFTPQLHYRYYILDNQEEITPGRSTQKSNNLELIAAAGYHHTFVLNESWYINIGSEAGAGYLNTLLVTRGFQEYESRQDNFVFRWDARAGMGYNGKRVFAGGLATASGSSFRQEYTTAVNVETRLYFELFAGFRLVAPKFIRKRFEIY